MKKIVMATLILSSGFLIAQKSPEKLGMQNKDLPKGIEEGSKVANFTGKNLQGENFELSQALEKGAVVVYFYRGEWCPLCTRYFANLMDSLSLITDKGATFLAVSPEGNAALKQTAEKAPKGLTLVSDVDGSIMKMFDVDFYVTEDYQKKVKTMLHTSIAEANQQKEAVLPVPATYVLGKDGTVIYRYFDYNYKKRAPVSAIINALP